MDAHRLADDQPLVEFLPSLVSSRINWVRRHSNDTGLSATRGAVTSRPSSAVTPARENSSTSAGTVAALAFIAWARVMVARFQVNAFVSAILATESFHPCDEKPISGGR